MAKSDRSITHAPTTDSKFAATLSRMIAATPLKDHEIAHRVGMSRSLFSQLRNGITPPKGRVIPALAYILNLDPDYICRDICRLSLAAGEPISRSRRLDELLECSSRVSLFYPAFIPFPPWLPERLAEWFGSQDPKQSAEATLYLSLEHARAFWSRVPESLIRVVTPSELLFTTQPHPLLFLDVPKNAYPDFFYLGVVLEEQMLFFGSDTSRNTRFLLDRLREEHQSNTAVDLANFERKQHGSHEALVIRYIPTFSKMFCAGMSNDAERHVDDEQLLGAMEANAGSGVHYAFLFPSPRIDFETEIVAMKLRMLRTDWVRRGCPKDKILIREVDHRLSEREFILYTQFDDAGEPLPQALFVQAEDSPKRFRRATMHELIDLWVGFSARISLTKAMFET